MRNIITWVGTVLVYLTYFTKLQNFDSDYILLMMLSLSWLIVIWVGDYLFKENIYYWPAIPTAVYVLVIYKSVSIVERCLALNGIPTEFSDDSFYINTANIIANYFANGDLQSAILYPLLNQPGYAWFLGVLYFWIGIYQDTMQVFASVIINVLALSLTVLTILKYAFGIVQSRWQVLFWLSFLFTIQNELLSLAAVVRKDILIMAFISGIYIVYQNFRLTYAKLDLLLMVTLLLFLSLFRFPIGLAITILIIVDLSYSRDNVERSSIIKSISFAVISVLVVYIGYIANANYKQDPVDFLSASETKYAFSDQIGLTKILYDLPLLGPAIWYFLGPLISVFIISNLGDGIYLQEYPFGIGFMIYIGSKLCLLVVYYALFKILLTKGRHIVESKKLVILIILFTVLLQFGGEGAESRHFSMVYPFMLLLILFYYPLVGYYPRYTGNKWPDLTQENQHAQLP